MFSNFSSVKNVLSNPTDMQNIGLLRQPTRERRATVRLKKVTNVHVVFTGYLFMRSKGGVHKQYYFVLTEESLTFYRKKNDSRAKGEISLPVKIVQLANYAQKNAFQVIPLKFDKYQYEFVENSDESILLYADTASLEKEWSSKMQSITQKIMEPYIFPDAIDDDGDAEVANDFNATQQRMHDKLSSMLENNYFNLSSSKSKWRSSLSLRGLTSEDTDINELNRGLRIGEISAADNNKNSILSASCLAVHNQHNLMCVGARPAADNANNGLLSIYNVTIDSTDDDDHDLNLVKEWQISDGIVSIDWRENVLLVSTTEGRVYYYQIDYDAASQQCYLVAHNEHNPSEPVIYTHSTLQQHSKYTLLSAPGSWMHSLRINSVKISCMAKPDCFLCIENESFHLWSLDSRGNNGRPVYSQKASTSPLFAIEWNPHHNHQFMVAGVSTNLKIIDTRELTNNPSKSVPWKMKKAHCHTITNISWNLLVEYWIATASHDGCVKIWDTRYNSGPVRSLLAHNNVVNTVKWSESHCELLISGSDDRSMKLWNLRSPTCSPHYLLYSHLFANPVIGCGYSAKRPMQFFGLSSGGELQSVELTDNFVADFVPHRFTEKSFEKRLDANVNEEDLEEKKSDFAAARNIELMIYMRDMESAHRAIPALADKQWFGGNYEAAQDLLNSVSTVGFQSTLSKYHKQYNFDEMLNKIAPFYHPLCVVLSRANQCDVALCEQMKLRMFIRKVLNKKEWRKLLIMKDKIFKHLLEMGELDNNLIVSIIKLLKKYSYIDACKWCIDAAELYYKNKKYSLFLPIAVSLLYPTIYHFADKNIVKSPDLSLLRKSAHILDRKLRDYEYMRWQLNLLLSLNECLERQQYDEVSINIIKVWESFAAQKREINVDESRTSITLNIDANAESVHYSVLSQTAYRLYFNALLAEGHCDTFFIECTQLSHRHKGYEISYIITDMMDNEGYNELHLYLESQLNDQLDDINNMNVNMDEIRLRKCCDGVISIVNICENCPILPKCLKNNLPKYLKKFQINLQDLFKLMDTKYKNQKTVKMNMINFGKELIKRIKQIQENKLNTEYYFRNEIHNLMTMVQAFCLQF